MKTSIGAVVLLLVGIVLLAGSMYTVDEREQVIVTQFGKPVGDPVTEAGLHFKLPFIQQANRISRQILSWDGEAAQIPTGDKRRIELDNTARWRIAEPLKFLQTLRTQARAQDALSRIIGSATRDLISSHNLVEAVRNNNRILEIRPDDLGLDKGEEIRAEPITLGREELMRRILESARKTLHAYGIELLDVRIKRTNYIESVRREVYNRMVSERKRIAERYRSEGEQVKARIEGERQRDERQILSEGKRSAQETMAEADAESARIYAEAYGQNPAFYEFYRSLESYDKAVGENHTLVIPADSPFYRLFFELEPR